MEEPEVPSTSSCKMAPGNIKALDCVSAASIRNSQVITKVSDVVRELVENAVDADASRILVYLEKHGVNKIEVRDNGHGIPVDDVQKVFHGGHTSKLSDTKNLSRGQYFGFKGEALRAICAAGHVSVSTKVGSEQMGRKYRFSRMGTIQSEGKASHSGGTNIIVEKLFDDFPVRRRILDSKHAATNDVKDIETYLKGVALANPRCHLSLYNDNIMIWAKASVPTAEQALVTVLGLVIAKQMDKYGPIQVPVNDGVDNISGKQERCVQLYLPKPPVDMQKMSFTSNKLTMIFCNRKRVFIREFEKLLHQYITSVVLKPQPSDQRRFPVCIVFITVPSDEVDFNRDLDKSKVFLVHKREIYEAIENALMGYYKIDLKKDKNELVEQADKIDCNLKKAEMLTLGSNNMARNSGKEKGPSLSPILSPASGDRESSIGLFLEDLPSINLTFSEDSVNKLDLNSKNKQAIQTGGDSSVIRLDSSQCESSTKINESNDIGGPAKIISNFDIFVDSQMLTDGDEDETSFVKPKGCEKSLVIEDKEVPEHLTNQVEKISANNFQNWINGRMPDEQGRNIENVFTVTNPPDSLSTTLDNSSDEISKFRTALMAGRSKFNISGTSTPRAPLSSQTNSSFIGQPPQKKQKLSEREPMIDSTFVTSSPASNHSFTTGNKTIQPTLLSFVNLESSRCSTPKHSNNHHQTIPNSILELRPPLINPSSTAAKSLSPTAAVLRTVSSTIGPQMNPNSPKIVNNCEERRHRHVQDIRSDANLSGVFDSIRTRVSNSSISVPGEFSQVWSEWTPSLDYIEKMSNARIQPQLIGSFSVSRYSDDKDEPSSFYITQTDDGIGVFDPQTFKISHNKIPAESQDIELSSTDIYSNWSKFLEKFTTDVEALKSHRVIFSEDQLIEAAKKSLLLK